MTDRPRPHIMSSVFTNRKGMALALAIDADAWCGVEVTPTGRWFKVWSHDGKLLGRHRTAIGAWSSAFFKLIRCANCDGCGHGFQVHHVCVPCDGHGQRRLTPDEAAKLNAIIPNLVSKDATA